MNYPIPQSSEEIIALQENPISDELIAAAIAGVVGLARSEGQSLEELIAQVLQEDHLLNTSQRYRLSDIVTQAWESLP
jgi:hypothetical protein